MKITGNEPSMPQPIATCDGGIYATVEKNPVFMGLTIREQFAMAAMQGASANTALEAETIARYAVANADALIAELNKPTKAELLKATANINAEIETLKAQTHAE